MTLTLTTPLVIEAMARAEDAWARSRAGDEKLREEWTTRLKQWTMPALERIFTSFAVLDRARLLRLCAHLLDRMSTATWKQAFARKRFLDGLTLLIGHLFQAVDDHMVREPVRDEERRFIQAVREAMSLEMEDRLVDYLTLRKAMDALARKNIRNLRCFVMMHWLGYSHNEIAVLERLTVQRVRTRIKKAGHFLAKEIIGRVG